MPPDNNRWTAVIAVIDAITDLLKYAIDGPGRWWKLAIIALACTVIWWIVGGGGAQILDHVLSGTSPVPIPQRLGG